MNAIRVLFQKIETKTLAYIILPVSAAICSIFAFEIPVEEILVAILMAIIFISALFLVRAANKENNDISVSCLYAASFTLFIMYFFVFKLIFTTAVK